MSADRYRGVAPLPALGGVARELAVDQVADHRVALARIPAGPRGALAGELLRRVGQTRHPSLAPVLDTVVDPDGAHDEGARLLDGDARAAARRPARAGARPRAGRAAAGARGPRRAARG
ncbi:MAG: hypothetical protein ACKOSO_03400 [Actinomycetota bacterium]